MSSSAQPYLSIVIPAHNESQRLPESLQRVDDFVQQQPFACEVLVVENASRDDTGIIAETFAQTHPYLQVLRETQPGKGRAVRQGVFAARGEYIFQCDVDFSMPVTEITKFLPPKHAGYDVAIASREGPGARRHNEPIYRHIMGRVFNALVQILILPGIHDTQCGFKCYRRSAIPTIFNAQTMNGFGYDVEVLFIARQRQLKIIEVPIVWYYGPRSTVSPMRDSLRMLREVWQVRANAWRGKYD